METEPLSAPLFNMDAWREALRGWRDPKVSMWGGKEENIDVLTF